MAMMLCSFDGTTLEIRSTSTEQTVAYIDLAKTSFEGLVRKIVQEFNDQKPRPSAVEISIRGIYDQNHQPIIDFSKMPTAVIRPLMRIEQAPNGFRLILKWDKVGIIHDTDAVRKVKQTLGLDNGRAQMILEREEAGSILAQDLVRIALYYKEVMIKAGVASVEISDQNQNFCITLMQMLSQTKRLWKKMIRME